LELRDDGGVDRGDEWTRESDRFVGVLGCFGRTLGGVDGCTSGLDFGVEGFGGVK
jgi:hypothetical protein